MNELAGILVLIAVVAVFAVLIVAAVTWIAWDYGHKRRQRKHGGMLDFQGRERL